MSKHYLSKLFEPASVALFGASERENSVGAIVLKNLLESGFRGKVFPINPKRKTVQQQKCYPNLEEIHENVDLAVITSPASTIPDIITACGEKGVKSAVIISAGFREIGDAGKRLEQVVIENAKRFGIRFIGPNCLGILRPSIGLNATFNRGMVSTGKLALVSQSGALCTAILDWAASRNIGFSSVISMGISADLDFGEVLDYLTADPQTESILLYIEGIQNARSFMSSLRAAARSKPVIVLKVGRHQAGSKAAISHTGALVGNDDVFDAALRRAGVVRGFRINDLFVAATVLSAGHRIQGDQLAIITNGGGPGAMAGDHASDKNIPLAALSQKLIDELNSVLPNTWSHDNPVDIIGDAPPDRYENAIKACLDDNDIDGILTILTPQAMTEPLKVAEKVIPLAKKSKKPVFSCWMGGSQVEKARSLFEKKGIPTFQTPEAAIEGFSFMMDFHRNQRLLLQTPSPLSDQNKPDIEGAQMIIEGVLAEKRKVLTETESKAVLSAFHIPVNFTAVARSANEALIHAESMGFPVAMKIYSKDITHKSDVGGVRLGVENAIAVRNAFKEIVASVEQNSPETPIEGVTVQPMFSKTNGRELLVGIITDPAFGPVITFGAGGSAVEVIKDRAVALPPLNQLLVQNLIRRTRVSKMLGPFRNMPAIDKEALEQCLLRISEMICELPWIQELDINPLIANENGVMVVDARIVVGHRSQMRERYSHMAIHPYPANLVEHWQLAEGTNLTIRPIRPEDANIEQEFVRGLSQEAKYFRFMSNIQELSPAMLAHFTQIDYDREMALIAVIEEKGKEHEIGVCRYITNADGKSCEFAVVIADEWQHHSIAHKLMESLIDCARNRGLELMEGFVLSDNRKMLALAQSLGFAVTIDKEDLA
ncbi:MAG: bifunctional acetate--CoA ligase family protein/GNAT family N-acetyltransferase, partial [SAR324 cluster bacterium]|nr:bifunctional acetate--CoA ligase family protein/GNAT family N-acetyltransferase [SAR324 cluster bacterium]